VNTHCTISLYDEATGEALASFRVEIDPLRPIELNERTAYTASLVAVSPKPLVSGYDAIAAPLTETSVLLTATVLWPGYHPAPISLTIEAGDSLKVKLRSDPNAEPFTPEDHAGTPHRQRPSARTPATARVDDVWQALRLVLEVRRYRDDSDIGRARRAVALLMHRDGSDIAQADVLQEVHARANAYLDQQERTLP
jgi:hypothetical protein